MESEAIKLRFDRRDYSRMAMAECKDAVTAKAIDELLTVDVAHYTAFALPFYNPRMYNVWLNK